MIVKFIFDTMRRTTKEGIMKKLYLSFALILMFAAPSLAQDRVENLVLIGPKSSVTHPMAYMIEAGLLDSVAEKVELITWDNPDQLRSLLVGGQAHFAAVPSYVASVFYNKGVPIRLLNITAWGLLYMASNDPTVKTLADLKGRKIDMPYRNDMPDLVFRHLVSKQGMDPDTDFDLHYKPNFPTIVQELLSGLAPNGLLVEPLASVAFMKSKAMKGKAAKLYRAVNLQKEWGKLYNSKPQIPQAGICATPLATKNPGLVNAFEKAFEKATAWCVANPEKAGKIVVKYIPGLKAKPVAAALKNAGLKAVLAAEARPEIEQFYRVLQSMNPAKIGGKLPAADFYWNSSN